MLQGRHALEVIAELSSLNLGTGPETVSPLNPLGYLINQLRGVRDQLHRQLPVISRLMIWQVSAGTAAPSEGITCAEYRTLLALLNAGCTLAMTWRDSVLTMLTGLSEAAAEPIPGTGMADQVRTVQALFERIDGPAQRLARLDEEIPANASPFGGMFGIAIISIAVGRSGGSGGHAEDGRNGG